MNLKDLKYVYLIGIGGIGMSGLARYFKALGKEVSGYDKTPSPLTEEMEHQGIKIHFKDDMGLVCDKIKSNSKDTLIIYTPAVPEDHHELTYFRSHNFSLHKRAGVLGWITHGHYTVAIAGTHGKTTTTTLVTHILKSSHTDCMAFLGGVSKNYHTNVLLENNISENTVVVVEADEYDRSFLQLNPNIAIITSIDPDHLDIYKDTANMQESYAMFANRISADGSLVTKEKVNEVIQYGGRTYTYSLNQKADYYARNITIKEGHYQYDIVTPKGDLKDIMLGVPGLHNVENSVAATAVAQLMNVKNEDIRAALGTFEGVQRRFDYQIISPRLVFIDDYAHHPEELSACINSVKAMYPGKKITGIFQPHLYSRTRDFADGFARSLELLDRLILLDIYPARELPIEGVDSAMLLNKTRLANKKLCTKEELIDTVTKDMPEVLITMGAGDIDRLVEPLRTALLKKIQS
ncbi:MAG: UDP-N-acetylmuramate--L-alanine ligase [Bacteroidia bacterium]